MKVLCVILITIILAGCGPSAEQMTATAALAQAQTQTAEPTFTPTATSTRTPSPTRTPTLTRTQTPTITSTSTPTLTLTPSPTPSLPKIMGKIQMNFVPFDDKTIIPQPPFELAMMISPASGGKKIRIQSNDNAGNFIAYLEPGKYLTESIVIKNDTLGTDEYEIETDKKNFMVPSASCTDVGIFSFTVVRLPPGGLMEQAAILKQLAKGQGVSFTYLETGSFFEPAQTEITGPGICPDLPPAPLGFDWKYLPESSLAVLAPINWHFESEQDEEGSGAYYFTPQENIDDEGTFQTGMTILVIRENILNAAQLMYMIENLLAGENIKKPGEVSERTEGNLTFFEFQYEVSFPTYDGTVHFLFVVNKTTSTLYLISFESPSIQWDEAWIIGQVMLEQMWFLR